LKQGGKARRQSVAAARLVTVTSDV
jgi:hypothetical protein